MAHNMANTDPAKEFPILCDTCLGPNKHTRMLCKPNGAACKVCERPFTVFRWQPGPGPRYKKTEVCRTCAKVKNVCQTCIFDLVYGLPVQVRDTINAQNAENEGETSFTPINVPKSAAEASKLMSKVEHSETIAGAIDEMYSKPDSAKRSAKLLESMRRNDSSYSRNKSAVCSFWLRGECSRGDLCPFLHEQPHKHKELAKQDLKSRYYGNNDVLAEKMLENVSAKMGASTSKYPITPNLPEDPENTTIWVDLNPYFKLNPSSTQRDASAQVLQIMQPYGVVKYHKVRHLSPDQRQAMVPNDGEQKIPLSTASFAMVRFETRQQAENALTAMYPLTTVSGADCHVNWSKKQLQMPGQFEPNFDGVPPPPPPPPL